MMVEASMANTSKAKGFYKSLNINKLVLILKSDSPLNELKLKHILL